MFSAIGVWPGAPWGPEKPLCRWGGGGENVRQMSRRQPGLVPRSLPFCLIITSCLPFLFVLTAEYYPMSPLPSGLVAP